MGLGGNFLQSVSVGVLTVVDQSRFSPRSLTETRVGSGLMNLFAGPGFTVASLK